MAHLIVAVRRLGLPSWLTREGLLTPPGKPPPLAVRLEEALPFRRVIDDLLSMNREVQKRRSTCESGKANRT